MQRRAANPTTGWNTIVCGRCTSTLSGPASTTRSWVKKVKPWYARAKIPKRINSTPAGDYLEAKRFLNNFEAACVALEKGEAVPYFRFQNWIDKGMTIQDVAGYMIREGLYFAPAVPGDEQAYRALHSALAAYDVEVHALVSTVAAKARN